MTRASLQANLDALKALPAMLCGPHWQVRLASYGAYACGAVAVLAQMDWSQGELALLIPAGWKPLLFKLSAGAAGLLKTYELLKRVRRDRASLP